MARRAVWPTHPDISFGTGGGLGRFIATEAGGWLLIVISTDVQNEYSYICTLPQPIHSGRREITIFFYQMYESTVTFSCMTKLRTSQYT
jgi:hypothetical protein